jgi:hypothetical protein
MPSTQVPIQRPPQQADPLVESPPEQDDVSTLAAAVVLGLSLLLTLAWLVALIALVRWILTSVM